MQIKQIPSKTDRGWERCKGRIMEVPIAGPLLSLFYWSVSTLWRWMGHNSFTTSARTPGVPGHYVFCSALDYFAVLCIFL